MTFSARIAAFRGELASRLGRVLRERTSAARLIGRKRSNGSAAPRGVEFSRAKHANVKPTLHPKSRRDARRSKLRVASNQIESVSRRIRTRASKCAFLANAFLATFNRECIVSG